jgi:proteasome lid subunit RPN8/RPN11
VNRAIDPNDPAHPSNTNQIIPVNGRSAERLLNPNLDKSLIGLLTGSCLSSHKERCGFISEDEDIFYVNNVHEEPTHNFLMDADDFVTVVSEIYDIRQTSILGVFHTHPNNVPWPTPRDLVGWPNPMLGWRYWIVTNRSVIEWKLVGE